MLPWGNSYKIVFSAFSCWLTGENGIHSPLIYSVFSKQNYKYCCNQTNLTLNHNYFCRTVSLWRSSQTLSFMFTLLVTSEVITVTIAVIVGISPSTAPSAALLAPLTVCITWQTARASIFTVNAILKVTVATSTRERCEWDSGLEAATLATSMLTRTQAGRQCLGSSLKRFQKLSCNHVTRNDSLDFLEKPWYSKKVCTAVVLQTFVSTDSKLLYQLRNKVHDQKYY